MREPLTFFVPGFAKPAGSKKSFALKKGGVYTGRTATVDDCKGSRSWKSQVSEAARTTFTEAPLTCPLRLVLIFTMPRPKGHYGSGKNAAVLKSSAPHFHTSKPDATKLIRAVEDALTGIVWKDDAQVCIQTARKLYGERSGCQITITAAEPV